VKTYLKVGLFLCLFLTDIALAQNAHALFQMTSTPRRGGHNIRFEAAQPGGILRNEEVTVAVVSDLSAQYRIYQTVFQPLTNEFGDTIPQGSFIMFSPSNPLGTLRTQLETPVTMGQNQIYVSNAAGESDEFVLVYNVHIPENQPGGIYRTQLQLTAELVSPRGGVSASVVNMEVRVEINPTFRLTILNVAGGKTLDLGTVNNNRPNAVGALNLNIESNIGTSFRIVQQMTEPLVSQEGVPLDDTDFQFVATGAQFGTLSGSGTALAVPTSPSVLYTSSEQGGGTERIVIQYQVTPTASQKAGTYFGNLSFKIESQSPLVPSEVINIPIKLQIESIFYLDTQTDQGSRLYFGTFKNTDEAQSRSVRLTVHSNLGQPYQVTQIVSRRLTSQEGVAVPKEAFTYFGSEGKTGVLSAKTPVPVPEGESAVFTSDKNGTPESFILSYSLQIPKETKAGSYTSEVKYSVTTL